MTRSPLRRGTPAPQAPGPVSHRSSAPRAGSFTAGLIASGIMTPSVMAPVVLALALGLAQPARADMVGEGGPTFTASEVELILRNERLRRALGTSPWAVLGALRIMEAQNRAGDFSLPPRAPASAMADGEAASSADPDIDQLERIAPEAALDLFTLLKQAGNGQPR